MLYPHNKKHCNKCNTTKFLSEFSKALREKDGYQPQCKSCKKEHYIANIEIILTQHKSYYVDNIKSIKSYRQSPIGKASAKNTKHKRRSVKKQGDVTNSQILELQQNAKVCYWCNAPLKNKKVHIDHYVPFSKGGEHTISNLVVACGKCNQTKSAKDPFQFANSLGRLL